MEVVAHPWMTQPESMALTKGLQVEVLADGVVGGHTWRMEESQRVSDKLGHMNDVRRCLLRKPSGYQRRRRTPRL
jgi:hypothetical protein